MCEDDEVPDAGEHDPGDDERGGEAEQRPGPRQVDHRGEEVFEEPVYLYLYLYLCLYLGWLWMKFCAVSLLSVFTLKYFPAFGFSPLC